MSERIKQADTALSIYYKSHGSSYFDDDGIGKFELWAEDNGFDSDGIEEEFNINPIDSSLTDIDENFPPIKNKLDAKQIVEVLRKCWTEPNAYNNKINDINETQVVRQGSMPEFVKVHIDPDYVPPLSSTRQLFCKKSIKEFETIDRSQLIISGYTRMKSISIDDSVVSLICHFYYHKFRLLPFSTSRLDPCVDDCSDTNIYKLSCNNIVVTKIDYPDVFCVSDLVGYKTGIHVFRYNMSIDCKENLGSSGLFWGIQAPLSERKTQKEYANIKDSLYVQGWDQHGSNNHIMSRKTNLKRVWSNEHKCSYRFDLKLNCNENTLSFVGVSNDNKPVKNNFKKQTTINIPPDMTKEYGWVPLICLACFGQSIIIAEINPIFYGIPCNQVDSKTIYFFNQNNKKIEN